MLPLLVCLPSRGDDDGGGGNHLKNLKRSLVFKTFFAYFDDYGLFVQEGFNLTPWFV